MVDEASAQRSDIGLNVPLQGFASTSQNQFNENGNLRIVSQAIPPPFQQVPDPISPVENPSSKKVYLEITKR
jgi:hypothetical protein